MKKCPYCGEVVSDDTVHCPKCLAGIPKETTEPPVEEQPKQANRRKIRS